MPVNGENTGGTIDRIVSSATHTTVFSDILKYQIPTYLEVELPGVKNPKAKSLPSESKRVPSRSDRPGAMVSVVEMHNGKTRNKTNNLRSSMSSLCSAAQIAVRLSICRYYNMQVMTKIFLI